MSAPKNLRAELARLLPTAFAAVVLGITAELIVATRPVEPLDPPLPSQDSRASLRIAAADHATSKRLEAEPPPAEVRAIGSAFLEWNLAAAAAPVTNPSSSYFEREALTREIRSSMGVARITFGDKLPAMLADLRARHAESFLDELAAAGKIGRRTPELDRLSGALIDVLLRNGWIDEALHPHVPASILRARYKLHWTSIVFSLDDCDHTVASACYGQTTLPLDTAELHNLLAFLVSHPVIRPEDVTLAHDAAIDRRRLVYLERMAELDVFLDPTGKTHPLLGDYDVDLGRGAMLYRLGQYGPAADSLRAAAAAHPTDKRARNWLLAALQKTAPAE